MPYDELLVHCQESHLRAETREEARIYEEAGRFNVIMASPVALFLDDGRNLYMAYENDAYRKVMKGVGISGRAPSIGSSIRSMTRGRRGCAPMPTA